MHNADSFSYDFNFYYITLNRFLKMIMNNNKKNMVTISKSTQTVAFVETVQLLPLQWIPLLLTYQKCP